MPLGHEDEDVRVPGGGGESAVGWRVWSGLRGGDFESGLHVLTGCACGRQPSAEGGSWGRVQGTEASDRILELRFLCTSSLCPCTALCSYCHRCVHSSCTLAKSRRLCSGHGRWLLPAVFRDEGPRRERPVPSVCRTGKQSQRKAGRGHGSSFWLSKAFPRAVQGGEQALAV